MEAKKMKTEEILKFKRLFEQERKNLLYTHQVMNEEFYVLPEDLLDAADFTSSELETSMRIRLRNREALYLKKIQEALQRIEEGKFGECQGCGEEIGMKRLQARPTAIFCVFCKEDQERQEKSHIDGTRPKSLGTKVHLA